MSATLDDSNMPSETKESVRPALPMVFNHSRPRPELVYQGAEALVYKTTFPQPENLYTDNSNQQYFNARSNISEPKAFPAFLKHRPRKPYRHPSLDAKLTKHRILSEARVLLKLRREGLRCVPALYTVDWDEGWMIGEWVDGGTIRALIERDGTAEIDLLSLMKSIGKAVGDMHRLGVVHGDLTTSNLMLRHPRTQESSGSTPEEIVIIDFGLSAQTQADEDRAVDLYVLERAFGSTHPQTELLWEETLTAYGNSYKGAKATLKRLEEVRARGRKKIMIG